MRMLVRLALLAVLMLSGQMAVAQTPSTTSTTAQSLDVTWSAPSPVGGSGTIAGYNIYKCTPSTSEGSSGCVGTDQWQKINSSPEASTGYNIAQSALPSPTYSFYVETVDSAGNVSIPSAIYTITPQWGTTTIAVPNPPTGLGAKVVTSTSGGS